MLAKVTIDSNRCKGCALCTTACPFHILVMDSETVNMSGYNPVKVIEADKCTGCASCARICPDVAIRIERK